LFFDQDVTFADDRRVVTRYNFNIFTFVRNHLQLILKFMNPNFGCEDFFIEILFVF
jgi:hypothetical protein